MAKRELIVDGRVINDDSAVFTIAEIGHNHQGNIETCKAMFRAAKECGCTSVKLQKRDNRARYTQAMYDEVYNSENAYAPTYGAHREALEFNREQYAELMAYARELGLVFFSTAFDIPSADLLESIGVPCYKIASGDLKTLPLIKHVARFGKPMFISTGGGTMEDVQRMYEAVAPINDQVCILQCTSGYPPPFEELNIRVIETYRNAFPDAVIGFSSHDNGIAMPLVAYMLGARVIEKHFTLNRAWKGTDQAFSLEPAGMKRVVRDLERARIALGDGVKRAYESETKPITKMAKTLVAARDLPAGRVLTEADITFKSPADPGGAPPYRLDDFVGRTLARPLKRDDTINDEAVSSAASVA
jgi:N-acetylneuraminate synthase/sialic acid synthase